MSVAALLLTGGSSRRMGADKAGLAGPDGITLAVRTAALLSAVAHPVVEVGPGWTALPRAADAHPGAGPLSAVAGGVAHLLTQGWVPGPALVVATDLPRLPLPVLMWLAGHPAPGSVVPLVDGHPQWLCARYGAAALLAAAGLVAAGEGRAAALGDVAPCHQAGLEEWSPHADAEAWTDADTPADLAAAWGGL